MKSDFLFTISVILLSGLFISIKGFQDHLALLEIFSIFLMFTAFLISSSLTFAALTVLINKFFTYLEGQQTF